MKCLKRDMNKRIVAIFLIFISVILLLTNCTKASDEYSAEYCREHYTANMPNLVCIRRQNKYVQGDDRDGFLFRLKYYYIKKVPFTQFVDFYDAGFMYGEYKAVLRHKDCAIDPIRDWGIRDISVYIMSNKDAVFDIKKLKNEGLKNEILDAARSYELYMNDDYTTEEHKLENERVCSENSRYCEKVQNGTSYKIRIHFKDCQSIVWEAEVCETEGKYYLKREKRLDEKAFEDDGVLRTDHYYYYVGEEFDEYIKDIHT